MTKLTGGQENINMFKDLGAENVQMDITWNFISMLKKQPALTTWKITLLMHVFFSFHMEEEALMNKKSLMVVLLHCQLI